VIEDELGPPSVSDDIRSQSGMAPPYEFHVGPWIVIAVILAFLIWLI
jgi:hypothetical protein